jgi:hypothetical protein
LKAVLIATVAIGAIAVAGTGALCDVDAKTARSLPGELRSTQRVALPYDFGTSFSRRCAQSVECREAAAAMHSTEVSVVGMFA